MQFEAVYDSVLDEFADSGEYGLSVTAEAGLTAIELIGKYPQPHGVFRESTVQAIEDGGFAIRPDFPGHALVIFPGPPDEATWSGLDGTFGPPQTNPAAGG
jgi:hypothetical protein